MRLVRFLRHVAVPHWLVRRSLSAADVLKIQKAIRESETHHLAELAFVVEGGLPLAHLFAPKPARTRAEELFASLRVWDTEHNSGVLVYVQLVDHRIEIVADRGIAARVAQSEWDALCRAMERRFRDGDYLGGALEAIEGATRLLERHFPPRGANPNELPDKPVVL